MPNRNWVLVLATEPVVAAMVGLLVELAGRQPVFAESEEAPGDAVVRLRPLAVVVDAAMDAARSDIFFAIMDKHGIGAAVFGLEKSSRLIAEIAADRAIPWFTLPPTAEQLSKAIDVASGGRSQVRGEERRSARTVVSADGTLILRDRLGQRWIVCDRRLAADRRFDAAQRIYMTRIFVSDAGERREYGASDLELAESSATALEFQLAHST